ncbi:MAG TPA: hypothetical protein VF203_11025 [Burkholderiales bacterium]
MRTGTEFCPLWLVLGMVPLAFALMGIDMVQLLWRRARELAGATEHGGG